MSFTIGDKKRLFKGKFLTVWSTAFLDNNGNNHEWEWVEKKNGAVIFAITPDNKVVLIKNYRVPLEKYIIECPAGLLDKDGESVEDAARRELLEETGYTVDKLVPLSPVPSSAALTSAMANFFIGTGAVKVSDSCGEDSEDIIVMEIPLDDLTHFYLNNRDFLFNLGILALYQIALELGLARPPDRQVARKL